MNFKTKKITKEMKKQAKLGQRKRNSKIKEEKLKQEKISLKKQVTELKAVNLRLQRNQMTMAE